MKQLEQIRMAKQLDVPWTSLHISGNFGPDLPAELDEIPFACCMGAALDGLSSCTCWEPVYDLDQRDPDLSQLEEIAADLNTTPATASQMVVFARERCCEDCAYRNGSPERAQGYTDELIDIAGSARFFCHDGMRRVIGWHHPALEKEIRKFFPTGLVPAGAGDYRPPILHGVAFRADGTPASLCAGWNAHRHVLLGGA